MARKKIKKFSVVELPEAIGSISDTINVVDKVKNAPSINLVQQMTGIPQDGVIAFEGDVIPEGYEEVEDDGGIVTVTNDNGTAIKYPDGTMICTKRIKFTNIDVNQTIGNDYMSDILELGAFAENFITTPYVNQTVISSQFCMLASAGWYSNTSCGAVRFVRPTGATVEAHVNIVAVGRWK